jgi:hypothetical protein
VAAPLLVLRPPGGLHHLPAWRRLRQRDRGDVQPAAGVRLCRGGDGAGLHRHPRLRPLGPPHVRDRPAAARLLLLHRREHGGGDPVRHPDLLLDRDHVGRTATTRRSST